MTEETLKQRVARRLRKFRIDSGRTVREVAAALDIDHTLIVKYEQGSSSPSFDRLDNLARIYGLTAAAMLADNDQAIALIGTIDQTEPLHLASIRLQD